jgi:hypothetical protein
MIVYLVISLLKHAVYTPSKYGYGQPYKLAVP